MKNTREYIINFGNLKLGKYDFDFHIDEKFFEDYEYSLVKDASIDLKLVLDKEKETFLILDFNYKGTIEAECDRCLDMFSYPVENHGRLLVKLTDKEDESGDAELVFLPSDAYQIDVRPFIYEFINLELPLRKICKLVNKKCNPDMIAFLSRENKANEKKEQADPRWDNLRNLASYNKEEE